jgi:hypothetical protein
MMTLILATLFGLSNAADAPPPSQPAVYYSIYPKADGGIWRFVDWIYLDGKFYTPTEFRQSRK